MPYFGPQRQQERDAQELDSDPNSLMPDAGLPMIGIRRGASLLSWLWKHRDPEQPVPIDIFSLPVAPGQKSALETLPQELMFEVLSRLPLESQACLAMCSRTMAKKLGNQYWLALREKERNPESPVCRYLQLLERDELSLYYCNSCLRLHHIDDDDSWYDRVVKTRDELLSFGNQEYYRVGYHHVQKAMARHRFQGAPPGRLDTLSCSAKKVSDLPIMRSKLFDMEARVAASSGHLLARAQSVIEMDLSTKLCSEATGSAIARALCRHATLAFATPEASSRLAGCCKDHDGGILEECAECHFQPLCSACPTRAALQRVWMGGRQLVVVTQWTDLGAGFSPEDPVWRSHGTRYDFIYRPEEVHQQLGRWWWVDLKWEVGSVRSRFEDQRGGVTVDELTAANLNKMRRHYKKYKQR